MYDNSLLYAHKLKISADTLIEITGINNVSRLDAELDSLRSNELLQETSGFFLTDDPLHAEITPSAFLLNMYPTTQGYNGSLKEFYTDQIIDGEINNEFLDAYHNAMGDD